MSDPSPVTIELRAVTKVYGGQTVLTDASVSIVQGERAPTVMGCCSAAGLLLYVVGTPS